MKKVNSILFFTSLCVMFSCGLINDSSENSDDNKPMISAVKSRLMGLSLNKVEDLLVSLIGHTLIIISINMYIMMQLLTTLIKKVVFSTYQLLLQGNIDMQ